MHLVGNTPVGAAGRAPAGIPATNSAPEKSLGGREAEGGGKGHVSRSPKDERKQVLLWVLGRGAPGMRDNVL